MLKICALILTLALAAPAMAAEEPGDGKTTAAEKAGNTAKADVKAEAEAGKKEPDKKGGEPEEKPGEYSCKYFTVTLPEDWKALEPPVEKQGAVNAIFAYKTGSPLVIINAGDNGGMDAKAIAGMFAEQFKAPKAPVEKNGMYTFSFTRQDIPAQAYVGTEGKDFLVTTITGDQKIAGDFIRKNIKSEVYTRLLPK